MSKKDNKPKLHMVNGEGEAQLPANKSSIPEANVPVFHPDLGQVDGPELIVTKLMVQPLVSVFKRGRLIKEFLINPVPIFAHESDEEPWTKPIADLCASAIKTVIEQLQD